MVGPSAPAITAAPPMVPSAFPRSALGNVVLTMATLPGSIKAPPTPWTTRATNRTGKVGAKPPTTDAAAKQTVPIRNTRRRPNTSPSRPPSMRSPDSDSRLAFSTHWATWVPTPNCCSIAGRASGTAVWSMRIMAFATIMATSTNCRPWADGGAAFDVIDEDDIRNEAYPGSLGSTFISKSQPTSTNRTRQRHKLLCVESPPSASRSMGIGYGTCSTAVPSSPTWVARRAGSAQHPGVPLGAGSAVGVGPRLVRLDIPTLRCSRGPR